MSEQEEKLISQMENYALDMKNAKIKMEEFRQKFIDAESELIFAKENFERTREELRVTRARSTNVPLTIRELDIERFRKELPRLMKKIEK